MFNAAAATLAESPVTAPAQLPSKNIRRVGEKSPAGVSGAKNSPKKSWLGEKICEKIAKNFAENAKSHKTGNKIYISNKLIW